MATSGKTAARRPAPPKTSPKRRRMGLLMLLLLIPILIGLVYMALPSKPKTMGPKFQKEGTLQFMDESQSKVLANIDIELAETDEDRTRGLMWRRSMEEEQGMLFIMDQQEMQSFWMLNTYISLDILYIDEAFRIVTIRKNTQPQTLDPVPSSQPARYVLEVKGGYCDRHGIREGHFIKYERAPAG